MYELYSKLMEAFHDGSDDLFNARARNWIEGADNVNFEDAEANELFAKAKMHCAVWRSNAINSRSAKVKMFACVRKIAEKNLPNPYRKEEIEEPSDDPEEDPIEEKVIESFIEPKTEESKEVQHVLGVQPEGKKSHIFQSRKKR